MDENTMEKFKEKLKELLSIAQKKKNVLEYQEISDFFQDMSLNAEQFEMILVDDGSTDDSRTICEEYVAKDDRLRLVCQNNAGVLLLAIED